MSWVSFGGLGLGGMEVAQGVPIRYGPCEGGPFNAKQMAHHEPSVRVAIDKFSKKVVPGVQAGDAYDFGLYNWDGRAWIWQG